MTAFWPDLAEKTAKNFRGLLFFAAPCISIQN